MKPHLLTMCLCLLLGAILNVLVAWGCCLVIDPPQGFGQRLEESAWIRPVPPEWPLAANATSAELFGASAWYGQAGLDLASGNNGAMLFALAVYSWGVPFRTLDYDRRLFAPSPSSFTETSRFGWRPPQWLGDIMNVNHGHRFPLRPVWPGFAYNTAIYAAAVWPLVVGPGIARRFWRGHRGLCPACAYPVGSGEVCSECGEPTALRTGAAL